MAPNTAVSEADGPGCGMRPWLGFSPTRPANAAGMRVEPRRRWRWPAATARRHRRRRAARRPPGVRLRSRVPGHPPRLGLRERQRPELGGQPSCRWAHAAGARSRATCTESAAHGPQALEQAATRTRWACRRSPRGPSRRRARRRGGPGPRPGHRRVDRLGSPWRPRDRGGRRRSSGLTHRGSLTSVLLRRQASAPRGPRRRSAAAPAVGPRPPRWRGAGPAGPLTRLAAKVPLRIVEARGSPPCRRCAAQRPQVSGSTPRPSPV